MFRVLLLIIFSLALPCGAVAQPILFSREEITIISQKPPKPEVEQPEQGETDTPTERIMESEEKADTKEPEAPVFMRHTFSTEIYPMSIMQIGWFSSRESLPQGRAIMVILDNKKELSLEWRNVSTPYDILFVKGNGEIHAIAPDLVLEALTEPLEITGRIKAIIYLRAGTAKKLNIKPHDLVEHSTFNPSPLILH